VPTFCEWRLRDFPKPFRIESIQAGEVRQKRRPFRAFLVESIHALGGNNLTADQIRGQFIDFVKLHPLDG
jgi:hypothetical protein